MSTIGQIAEQLGLSKSTVSRALRGVPGISEATVAAVQQRADELGYIPSIAAAGLSTGRNHAIGVVVPSLDRWFYDSVVTGISRELAELGYDVVLFDLDRSPGEATRLFHRSILRRRVDALLVVSTVFSAQELEEFGLIEMPVIAVGAPTPDMRRIGVDDTAIVVAAVQHLLDFGHRRIGLLGGYDVESLSILGAAEREQAFLEALSHAGLFANPAWMLSGGYRMGVAKQVTAELFARADRPTALVCASDEMAIGALHSARTAGLIPGVDVSIIGIDGHEYAEAFDLTTCAQDPQAQGAQAARQVVAEIDGAEPATAFAPSPFTLIPRGSTGPAPRG